MLIDLDAYEIRLQRDFGAYAKSRCGPSEVLSDEPGLTICDKCRHVSSEIEYELLEFERTRALHKPGSSFLEILWSYDRNTIKQFRQSQSLIESWMARIDEPSSEKSRIVKRRIRNTYKVIHRGGDPAERLRAALAKCSVKKNSQEIIRDIRDGYA